MGRINKSKKRIAGRNKNNSAKRYEMLPADVLSIEIDLSEDDNESELTVQGTAIPSTSFSNNIPFVTYEGGTTRPTQKSEKPTCFALYDSYRPVVGIDETALKHVLVNANRLVHFSKGCSCSRCVSTFQVSQMTSKCYDIFFIVRCKDCDFNRTFDTSASDRVSRSEDDST